MANPIEARANEENIDLAFAGYDEDARELYEIDEVRSFVLKLDEGFPYWFFFMSKSGGGLAVLAYCLLPPFLTEEAKKIHFASRIRDLVERRWGPALNHAIDFLGLPRSRADLLLVRSVEYLARGPLRPEATN